MIYIGCAHWTIPRPSAAAFPSTGTHLERYARVLPCTEINSSFHRPHRPATWQRWAASVPAGFRFSVKAPRLITHDAALACEPSVLEDFLAQALLLGDKLGPLLFQTPPKLAFPRDTAHRFFTILRALHAGPVALEPRHATWFTLAADQMLAQFDIARVAADPTPIPEARTPGGSRSLTYYRLHGSPRKYYSAYSTDFLADTASTLQQAAQNHEVWCIFDNTASGAATANALDLDHLLNSTDSAPLPPAQRQSS